MFLDSEHTTADDFSGLWQMFKNGDYNAFAQIYETHSSNLILYGIRIVPDKELVKDAIHDLFVDLWNSRQRLSDVDRIDLYLIKSLRHKLLRQIKKKDTTSDFISYDDLSEGLQLQNIPPGEQSFEVYEQKIRSALDQLTARQKEVVFLYFFLSFSLTQISHILSINYQSVANLLQRSIAAMKKYIGLIIFVFF